MVANLIEVSELSAQTYAPSTEALLRLLRTEEADIQKYLQKIILYQTDWIIVA